ncbi:Uncharacterised protein [Vibrio cholerae]|uniref:Uncharacterized protein n=1 Tax=Vibrio cholerae TaxID=666 RepID=A0A655Y812_VIBCL|nr:Uncharacterised protein [Vibrio cholerae]CSA72437.1 Uncharacterised protein [Vibrio cholerae]CSB40989.1 Uncharacterised protein [Vibrio cholerae]CSB69721.1 Uncharacterised protein [Vibrio cholerae]CSB83770.1 Uncharacterised protein [Vibrio cholerae]
MTFLSLGKTNTMANAAAKGGIPPTHIKLSQGASMLEIKAAYAPITIKATENMDEANAVSLPRTVGVKRPIIKLTATVK